MEGIKFRRPTLYSIFGSKGFSHIEIFQKVLKIIVLVGLLAIVISCMDLLGMVIYAMEGKTKEIGIRKVLGASEQG